MRTTNWNRFFIICVLASVVAGIAGIQLIRIQNIEGAEQILADSEAYQGINRMIYPERGSIYDSEGRLLAGNEVIYEVGLDLQQQGRFGIARAHADVGAQRRQVLQAGAQASQVARARRQQRHAGGDALDVGHRGQRRSQP